MSLPTSSLQLSDAVHSYWALLVSQRLVAELRWRAKLYRAATFSYDGTAIQRQHRSADYA